jgi:hypothetical protein
VADKGTREDKNTREGLCAVCQFARRIESARGSQFVLCERSHTDPAFPKYPRLPVTRCGGYVPKSGGDQQPGH